LPVGLGIQLQLILILSIVTGQAKTYPTNMFLDTISAVRTVVFHLELNSGLTV